MHSTSIRFHAVRAALLSSVLVLTAVPCFATWSIILIDTATREIGVGSATCLTGFDLERYLPVVRVRVGAGVAQSAVDVTGGNRRRIWTGLMNGLTPDQILANLAMNDSSHQVRQYGIVDVHGRALSFTGSACGAWAGGLTGQVGSIVYAIQGNVLTCEAVVLATEAAVRDTPGDIAEKLMAGMEAARALGGDGRCSCFNNDPTGCGCPPSIFNKSAHVGFIIVARRGDTDGVCNAASGCASGNYFLDLNVAGQQNPDLDPVLQLRTALTQFRETRIGLPDAVESMATLSRTSLLADGLQTADLTIDLRDWRGDPASDPASVTIVHDPDGSAGSCAIGPVEHLGDAIYRARITAGAIRGLDRFLVTASGTGPPVPLMSSPMLLLQDPLGDLNLDGVIDLGDLSLLLARFGESGAVGDIDANGVVDLADLARWLSIYSQGY